MKLSQTLKLSLWHCQGTNLRFLNNLYHKADIYIFFFFFFVIHKSRGKRNGFNGGLDLDHHHHHLRRTKKYVSLWIMPRKERRTCIISTLLIWTRKTVILSSLYFPPFDSPGSLWPLRSSTLLASCSASLDERCCWKYKSRRIDLSAHGRDGITTILVWTSYLRVHRTRT